MTTVDSHLSNSKTSRQIEEEIQGTRSAITEDLCALGDKLSPHQLKQEAKEVLRDAKEEAIDMLRNAKNHAIESVTDTMHELSDRARHAGTEAAGFASTHAVPLTLLGLGAGWLMLSLRHRRMVSDGSRFAVHREDSKGAVGAAVADLSHRAADLTHRAADLTHRAADTVMEIGHDAGEQARRVSAATRDFSYENPLAIGALALAAGVGVGLLLPATPAENDLMGASRDRLLRDARDTAGRMRHLATGAASELKDAITGP